VSNVANKILKFCAAANSPFVRIAVIGLSKMLRDISNVRFREAAVRRRAARSMSGLGRSRQSQPMPGETVYFKN
jgi:hypothetical protein